MEVLRIFLICYTASVSAAAPWILAIPHCERLARVRTSGFSRKAVSFNVLNWKAVGFSAPLQIIEINRG